MTVLLTRMQQEATTCTRILCHSVGTAGDSLTSDTSEKISESIVPAAVCDATDYRNEFLFSLDSETIGPQLQLEDHSEFLVVLDGFKAEPDLPLLKNTKFADTDHPILVASCEQPLIIASINRQALHCPYRIFGQWHFEC